MIEATQKQINDFVKYRSQHIALVERIGHVVFGENFSEHDFDKCTADARELNLFALRNAMQNGDYSPRGEIKYQINKLPGKHVKINKHHPEFYDDAIKAEDWDEGNPPQVHATRMPKKSLCEMVCDWCAVALKRNKPLFSWYNKVCTGENPRFVFTDNQKNYIIECINKVMDKIHSEKLYYPGITYNTKQVKPIIDLNEKSAISNEMESIVEYTKTEFINDVNKIEASAIKQYKTEQNPVRQAAAEGRIVACEDVKDLAKNLPGDYIPTKVHDSPYYESIDSFYAITTFDGTILPETCSPDISKVREERERMAKEFKDIFRIKKLSPEEVEKFSLSEKIIKDGSKWKVVSEDGSKNLGTYDTKAEAEERLKQVHYFKHMNESILDIPQKEYCSDVLTSEDKMNPELRSQILDTIENWKDTLDFDFRIKKVFAKGSLLSKRYTNVSDLDVTLLTDMTEDQLDEVVDIIPKGQNIIVDGKETDHPLDFYVLADEAEGLIEENVDNIYDVLSDKWVKRTPEYENEIPLDYMLQVGDFFIKGCVIALNNYENDKILYNYYNGLSPEKHEVHEDELKDIISEKKRDLAADYDALKMALHMISSFRQEGYKDEEGEASPFSLSLEITSDNPHVSANEQLAKILERFNIRQRLRDAVKECEELLGEDLKEEVGAASFTGIVPEKVQKIIDPSGILKK